MGFLRVALASGRNVGFATVFSLPKAAKHVSLNLCLLGPHRIGWSRFAAMSMIFWPAVSCLMKQCLVHVVSYSAVPLQKARF